MIGFLVKDVRRLRGVRGFVHLMMLSVPTSESASAHVVLPQALCPSWHGPIGWTPSDGGVVG